MAFEGPRHAISIIQPGKQVRVAQFNRCGFFMQEIRELYRMGPAQPDIIIQVLRPSPGITE